MENLLKDFRYGIRSLLKRPTFTAIALITLALGIGANTAIFSVVNTVLLRPLPFPEPERLMRLGESTQGLPERGTFSFPDFKDVRAQTQTIEYMSGYFNSGAMMSVDGSDSERVLGAAVSHEYFGVLGVKPVLGNVFTKEDDHPNATVVVISHGLWQRRFGGTNDVIGKQMKLGSDSVTIIGVMPPGYAFPFRAEPQDFWEPINDRPTPEWEVRDAHILDVIARTKPGVSVAEANAELRTIAKRLEQQYPATNTNTVIGGASLHADLTSDVRPALLIMFVAVGFVLLIACANVANLLLARAASRQKEIAIRSALGASRLRIMRQLLIESLLLSVVGGVLGLVLATWGVDLLVAIGPANIPRLQQVSLDGKVLAFTLVLSSVVGLAFGMVPAMHASKPDLNDALKDASRGSTENIRRNRARSALVVAEVALSLVLLIGAGLLIKSFVRLLQTNPGFEPNQVLALDIPLSRQRYDTPPKQAEFFQRLIERSEALPGVQAASVVNYLPLSNNVNVASFNIAGRPPFPPGSNVYAHYTVVSPGYFETLKIPLREGRLITSEDGEKSPRVIMVSEAFARRFFPGEKVIGQRLVLEENKPPREIVGIMGDVRRESLEVEADPEFYIPFQQAPIRRMNLIVRTDSPDPGAMTATVRNALKELDRDQMVWQTQTLDSLVAKSISTRRFNLLLLGVFASVALVLAALGVYGVMTYSVTRRTHEIGVRMALGARMSDVVKLVVKNGMALAIIGVVIGLSGAFALTRLMRSLLFGVTPTDAVTFVGVSLGMLVVALIACYLPARRAARVDPLEALRYE